MAAKAMCARDCMYLPWKHLAFTTVCVCVWVYVCVSVSVCVQYVLMNSLQYLVSSNTFTNDIPIHTNKNQKLTLLYITPDTSQSDGSQSQQSHNRRRHIY